MERVYKYCNYIVRLCILWNNIRTMICQYRDWQYRDDGNSKGPLYNNCCLRFLKDLFWKLLSSIIAKLRFLKYLFYCICFMDVVQVAQCSNMDSSGVERLVKIGCFCINHALLIHIRYWSTSFFSGTSVWFCQDRFMI